MHTTYGTTYGPTYFPGERAAISAYNDCPHTGRGLFPRQCNTTHHATGAPFAQGQVEGCHVKAVAGRVGAEYSVALGGAGAVAGGARYLGQGLYGASYVVPRVGQYDLTVAQAQCCGLAATLFNNRWLIGEPVLERVDGTASNLPSRHAPSPSPPLIIRSLCL